ncbi:MAG TPA: (d)CMP kinase [Chthonomonadaceae bacterium]|nr:(d)CMP kinase [Chthonomonadaceae bacterium]
MPFIVAIDGPAGAGKSTVARRVAAALGFTYIDTGAMYRALAWKALREGVDVANPEALAALAQQMRLAFGPLTPDGTQAVRVDGEDVTLAIREPAVSNLTSAISAFPAVRNVVVAQQRQMAQQAPRGVVLEGRDIGTVVFPNAQVKVFLTASPEERARRRLAELRTRGFAVDYAHVLSDMIERDARDSLRATSPLAPAPDAVILDTDGLAIDEVVARVLALCRQGFAGH